jgi:hypothetical protein
LNLQLPVQSVPITTKVVSLNPIHGEVYSIQLCQVGGFLRFPPPIKYPHNVTEILLKVVLNTINPKPYLNRLKFEINGVKYACFESFLFRLLFSSARPHDFDGMLGTGLPVSMYTTKSPIDMQRFNVPRLKEFLAFSVKDRYQLNYFICIKDFNAQTNTSLELNLFSSFIYCCERKMTCLDIFLLSDRQWGTEHQYLLSHFLGISILQLLIIYRICDYDMLTLSQ